MPDETTEVAVQSTPEPVVPEFVDPGPSVIVVYDAEGRAHHTSRTSPFAVKGLADGSLTYEPRPPVEPETPAPAPDPAPQVPEVPGGPEVPATGDADQSGSADGNGSGEQTAAPVTTGRKAGRSRPA